MAGFPASAFESDEGLLKIVKQCFAEGMKSVDLDDHHAPWLIKGLQKLENGEELTVADIKRFNQKQ